VAARLAKRFSTAPSSDDDGDDADERTDRPWLFPTLVAITKRWMAECVTADPDVPVGILLTAEATARASERLFSAIVRVQESRDPVLLPQFRPFDREGSSAEVDFITHKAVIDATKSQVSHVVLDGKKGNTWEENVAEILEHHDRVHAYVKNDHLGFEIPYVHEGRSHNYRPDFLVRLVRADPHDAAEPERTLIVEVSGSQKSPGPTEAKARTTRDVWCPAVNDHGGFGLWGYVELTNMATAAKDLNAAIEVLSTAVPPAAARSVAAVPVRA
jgi:type III restriction enzyme